MAPKPDGEEELNPGPYWDAEPGQLALDEPLDEHYPRPVPGGLVAEAGRAWCRECGGHTHVKADGPGWSTVMEVHHVRPDCPGLSGGN